MYIIIYAWIILLYPCWAFVRWAFVRWTFVRWAFVRTPIENSTACSCQFHIHFFIAWIRPRISITYWTPWIACKSRVLDMITDTEFQLGFRFSKQTFKHKLAWRIWSRTVFPEWPKQSSFTGNRITLRFYAANTFQIIDASCNITNTRKHWSAYQRKVLPHRLYRVCLELGATPLTFRSQWVKLQTSVIKIEFRHLCMGLT